MNKRIVSKDREPFAANSQPGTLECHSPESHKDIWSESDSRSSNPAPVFKQVDPRTLKPHQNNEAIYGADEDVTELVELIRSSGWVKPLVVTPTGTIISGHRRFQAVLALGWETLLVEEREFPDEWAELEALLLENASRLKNIEQKVREGQAWVEIEKHCAKQRQQQAAATTNQKLGRNTRKTLQENFPEASKGQSRDRIASKVGIGSGRTYQKAVKVVDRIDEDTRLGNMEFAQVLRQILNQQSVDAAHTLLKKSPFEQLQIAQLIISGQAKTITEAVKLMKQNNHAETHSPEQVILEGFSAGDWVLVNEQAQFEAHIGHKGQVEQLFPVEQQLLVRFRSSAEKERFYPHELTLIIKAPPPHPFSVDEIAFIDIDRQEAVATQEKRWNGNWCKVTHLGEVGSISVDVGSQSLWLFPRDLKQIDAQGTEFRSVVERVLRLRRIELDEVEERMLDVFQRREWLTTHQLIHLENIEKLYLSADDQTTEKHQVVSFRQR